MHVRVPFKLKDVFSDLGGKAADKDAEGILIVENKHFLSYATDFINPAEQKTELTAFFAYMKNTPLNEYSTKIIMNLPDPRIKYYLDPNYD